MHVSQNGPNGTTHHAYSTTREGGTATHEPINQWQDPAALMWSTLTHEERLALILTITVTETWYERTPCDYLSTLAYFRPIPAQWGPIWERFRALGGKPTLLQGAVDHLLSDEQTARAETPTGVETSSKPARRHAVRITARELKAKKLPPLTYVVDEILPAGCTLFTGKSKDGKSLAAYDLAVAVASGGKAFGCYNVTQGSVWYLALEDGERRAQERLNMIEDRLDTDLSDEVLNKIELTLWEAPRLGEGLEEDLTQWIEE